MRKLAVVLLGFAACDPIPPHHELHGGLSKEELEAGPTHHQMKGAFLNDVRIWRQLDRHLDEGKKSCPAVVYENNVAKCAKDQSDFEVYLLRSDPQDRPNRVEEIAFYCRVESVYYYHYVGGPQNRDVWLGPYRLERRRPVTDD